MTDRLFAKPQLKYAGRMDRYDDSAWLIWSNKRKSWYRPDSRGYTTDIAEAGIYTKAEAAIHYDGPEMPRRLRDTEPFPLSSASRHIDLCERDVENAYAAQMAYIARLRERMAGKGMAEEKREPARSIPINLLLADVRQALFDGAKADDGAGTALRYEVGRAVGLMGRAMDSIAALADAVNALLPSNLGSLNSDDFPDDFTVPVDMTAGEIRQARAAIDKAMGGRA